MMKKNEQPTLGLAKNWRDVVSFGFWLAIVQRPTRDVPQSALVSKHQIFFLIFNFGSGRDDFQIPVHRQALFVGGKPAN